MSEKKLQSHSISGVFVFLLLGIFAVFSTVMVLFGARAYKATSERTTSHNDIRIASAYIRSMVRSGDEAGQVCVEDIGGVQAITLMNVYGDDLYLTRLYAFDGTLRELFTDAEIEFEPENGEAVCAVESMTARIENSLLTVLIESGGQTSQVDIALRAAEH